MRNKELKYTYSPISQEVKVNRQWNLVSCYNLNIACEIYFFENHVENEAGILVPDFFLFLKQLYKVKASDQHFCFNMFC